MGLGKLEKHVGSKLEVWYCFREPLRVCWNRRPQCLRQAQQLQQMTKAGGRCKGEQAVV